MQLDHALAMEPDFTTAHARLREWYEIQGQFENARQTAIPQFPQFLKVKEQPTEEEYWRGLIEVARLRSESMGEGFTGRIFQATAWTQLGDHDKAMAWVEKSAARGDDLLPNFMRSPIMDSLRGDPRYAAVLHKRNLAP